MFRLQHKKTSKNKNLFLRIIVEHTEKISNSLTESLAQFSKLFGH
jgi:hypothetical protein